MSAHDEPDQVPHRHPQRSLASTGRTGCPYAYLTLGLFLMFGPVIWLVASSFKTEAALTEFPPSSCPTVKRPCGARAKKNPSPSIGSNCRMAQQRAAGSAPHWPDGHARDPAKPDEPFAST